jgi:hypothetical protein
VLLLAAASGAVAARRVPTITLQSTNPYACRGFNLKSSRTG